MRRRGFLCLPCVAFAALACSGGGDTGAPGVEGGAADGGFADAGAADAQLDDGMRGDGAIREGGTSDRELGSGDGAADAGCDPDICPAPRWQWDRTLGGGERHDRALAVAVAPNGDIVVGGHLGSLGFVARYGADGEHRWDRTFEAEAGETVRVHGVAVDGMGNVLATGSFEGTVDFGGGGRTAPADASDDGFVVALESGGDYRWDRTFAGDSTSQAQGNAIAIDDDGTAVVLGRFAGSQVDFGGGEHGAPSAVFMAAYAVDGGAWQWDRVHAASRFAEAGGIAIDGSGNIVVTGSFEGTLDLGGGERTSSSLTDGFVASYDSAGNHRWDHVMPAGGRILPAGVAVSGSGRAVVVGHFQQRADLGGGERTSNGHWDVFIATFDPTGSWLWDRTLGDDGRDFGWGVDVGPTGTVVITGRFEGEVDFGGGSPTSSRDDDSFVANYGMGGTYAWSRAFGGPPGAREYWSEGGEAVAFTADDRVLVAGSYLDGTDFGGGIRESAGWSDPYVLALGCGCP